MAHRADARAPSRSRAPRLSCRPRVVHAGLRRTDAQEAPRWTQASLRTLRPQLPPCAALRKTEAARQRARPGHALPHAALRRPARMQIRPAGRAARAKPFCNASASSCVCAHTFVIRSCLPPTCLPAARAVEPHCRATALARLRLRLPPPKLFPSFL
jgi:hypothetical protein